MVKTTIFGRCYQYDFSFEFSSHIRLLEKLSEEVENPHILCYEGYRLDLFGIDRMDTFIEEDSLEWLYNQKRIEKESIYDLLLRCSTEDVEWTSWRNRNLRGIWYRKITLLPEIQKILKDEYAKYIVQLKELQTFFDAEKRLHETERQQHLSKWTEVKVYGFVNPAKTDKWKDADYGNCDGTVVRMISRNVFDFGCYSYPKRFEGTDGVFDQTNWTSLEKEVAVWLQEFGPFRGLRM